MESEFERTLVLEFLQNEDEYYLWGNPHDSRIMSEGGQQQIIETAPRLLF